MESFRQIKNNNVDLISNNDPLDKNRLLIEDLWESVLREECPDDQAERLNMKHLLSPIYKVLEEGNQSMKWINQYEKGLSIEQIMKISIEDMIRSEAKNV